MKKQDVFLNAAWVGKAERSFGTFSVLRRRFSLDEFSTAELSVIGLGYFKCYVNGVLINPDTFLPVSSDFEDGCDPEGEVLTAHRIYVPRFDVAPYLRRGENVIVIHFGGGWYTFRARPFGLPKAIYRISVDNGRQEIVSGEEDRIGDSFVNDYDMCYHECHDLTDFDFSCLGADFDDSSWPQATLTEELRSDYCFTDCPADALMEVRSLKEVKRTDKYVIYDCGENTVGVPLVKLCGDRGESVTLRLAEELDKNGDIEQMHWHAQRYVVTDDGLGRTVQPEFTWFCFRYIEVTGRAEIESVKVIHANVKRSSSFECDNETLNWTYRTFVHSMQCNMHTGHPSDCPHLERLGYTGDGQVTCHSALTTLDAKEFYRKWMQDISDCQDTVTGRIQYTAPYSFAGGGPGGWGCAIIEVPYVFYRHYGETEHLKKYYPQMREYLRFLREHSENWLVTSNKEGLWCLGDWCGPMVLFRKEGVITYGQQMILPVPYVNTYFAIKCLTRIIEIARVIGREEDIPAYEEELALRRASVRAAYYNIFDSNFIMNAQGANAFAMDMGVGNSSTYAFMVDYYEKVGHYDTGIFGTEVVTRVLFERGNADTALKLLTDTESEIGYDYWRRSGATTFREYWQDDGNRSHCHQMFGSTVGCFFDYILGIRQKDGTAGYTDLIIEPVDVKKLSRAKGHITVNAGVVSVEYEKSEGGFTCRVCIPEGVKAEFRRGERVIPLVCGENTLTL
ncbi:MAG: family 78 glycoside hydrolase catalytic domain [Clostridia bacterium]|nr:family 78 glycoside hydrolase catalytic domain [Clostridia bacterium]